MIIGGVEVPMHVLMQGFLEVPTDLEIAEVRRDRMHTVCAVHSFFFVTSWFFAAFFYEYACTAPLIAGFFAMHYRRSWHKRQRAVEIEIVREVLNS